MNYEIYYRNRLSGSFLSTCQSPASIDEAREMMARAILSHIEIEDRGDDYIAAWEQLAESARKAEPGDVLEFDECAWKIEANRETVGERFGNRHNPALKWIPGKPETLHIESALTPNNDGEITVREFAGVGDFCDLLGCCDEDTVMTDAEWQSALVQLAQD